MLEEEEGGVFILFVLVEYCTGTVHEVLKKTKRLCKTKTKQEMNKAKGKNMTSSQRELFTSVASKNLPSPQNFEF